MLKGGEGEAAVDILHEIVKKRGKPVNGQRIRHTKRIPGKKKK